jgi:hypothetical protein
VTLSAGVLGLAAGGLALLVGTLRGQAQAVPSVLQAEGFGVTGDGVTDDGPAIRRMVAVASKADGPVVLQFPPGKTFRVVTGVDRYVFRFVGASHLTLDGGGGTFVLDPYLRFLSLTGSTNIAIRRLNVDFDPLPFVDGVVVAVDAVTRTLDVEVGEGADVVVGAPTREDGEQAFFAMLWHDGPYSTLSHHCWVDRMERTETVGRARVHPSESFEAFGQVVPGEWKISLPVPGIAHRYGPGPCFAVEDNDTVTLEDVNLWSAPWFGFSVSRNRGAVVFRRVNIEPRPGSGRLMSVWRDGFHVKGNRGSLLWEDCVLSGMNDDALNISTHSSVVQRVLAPTRVEVRQKFPLLPIPWEAGATLTAVDETAGRLLGTARVASVAVGLEPSPLQGLRAAPLAMLTLESAIEGLGEGTMVWDAAQCNPDTTLRGCHISMSCRLQSPVRLERCQVEALLWFYCGHVEGGFPHHVTLEDCVLKRGRGNPVLAVVFAGEPAAGAASPDSARPPRAIHDVTLRGNEIWGGFVMNGVERATLAGNRFLEPGAPVRLEGNLDLSSERNTDPHGDPL